jgi:hypothetical protein
VSPPTSARSEPDLEPDALQVYTIVPRGVSARLSPAVVRVTSPRSADLRVSTRDADLKVGATNLTRHQL